MKRYKSFSIVSNIFMRQRHPLEGVSVYFCLSICVISHHILINNYAENIFNDSIKGFCFFFGGSNQRNANMKTKCYRCLSNYHRYNFQILKSATNPNKKIGKIYI